MQMEESPNRHLDTYSMYVECGVANKSQVSTCLKQAISDAERILKVENGTTKYKVNLIVDKEGKYYGFGYIRISDPRVYWMLLGKNPDGSERIEEKLDPNWKPLVDPNQGLTLDEILEKNKNKNWRDLADEEDSLIQPKIKVILPPLVTIPGFLYDDEQISHLKELALTNGEEDKEIPEVGCFEISRAYASEPKSDKMKNRLFAKKVPDWIPEEAFKAIFSFYCTVKEGTNNGKKVSYPLVNFVNSKHGGRIVFVTFSPDSNDAIFALLMTKKTYIINPQDLSQKEMLIFSHAYNKRGK